MVDVLIIGNGIQGLTLAIELAERGAEVVIAPTPRRVVQGLLPERAIIYLGQGWLTADILPQQSVSFAWQGNRAITTQLPLPYAHAITMSDIYLRLNQAAVKQGVTLLSSPLSHLQMHDTHVAYGTEKRIAQAQLVVLCDDIRSAFDRRLGLPSPDAGMALELHVEDKSLSGKSALNVGVVRRGYGYFWPTGEGMQMGVASYRPVLSTLRQALAAFSIRVVGHEVQSRPHVRKLARVGEWPYAHGHRVLRPSFTAGIADAITGESFYYRLMGADLAREVVLTALVRDPRDLSQYGSELEAIFGEERRAMHRLSMLQFDRGYPFGKFLWRDEVLIRRYLGVVRGEETYRSFYRFVRGHSALLRWAR